MMGLVVDQHASDRTSHGDRGRDMHTRKNHFGRQLYQAPCEIACIQTRTRPSDEDAIEYQSRGASSNRSVQVEPVSVDVQIEPP
jgi:hypothetical protein